MNKIHRIASIDVARALTMLLMIWVNDFWTLNNIPKWLEHAKAGEDFLGFSDLIFPWFLFIVGLSIPFAIKNRLDKGDTHIKILMHILIRSIALLVMGVFLVNTESFHADGTGMSKSWFIIFMITGIFLVWNVYPKVKDRKKYLYYLLQLTGVIILVYLAIIYRGTVYGDESAVVRIKTHWWGILGLIGWTYLIAAPAYLFLRKMRYSMWIFMIAFMTLNIIGNSGVEYKLFSWQGGNWIVGNGAFHAFAFGGIVVSELLARLKDQASPYKFYFILMGLAIANLIAGFISHNYFPVSKISATPPWVFYSLSSGIVLFAFLHWLVDFKGKNDWFSSIKTAGTATLTCYLVPYYYYSVIVLLSLNVPDFMRNGWIGLLKSLAFAFIIVGITWIFGRLRVKLKI